MVSASTVPIVGRGRERAAVAEVVNEGGALCLCGPAGIGKTALLPDAGLTIAGCRSERGIPFGALQRATGTGPIVVDDAQWLDAASYDVLTSPPAVSAGRASPCSSRPEAARRRAFRA